MDVGLKHDGLELNVLVNSFITSAVTGGGKTEGRILSVSSLKFKANRPRIKRYWLRSSVQSSVESSPRMLISGTKKNFNFITEKADNFFYHCDTCYHLSFALLEF